MGPAVEKAAAAGGDGGDLGFELAPDEISRRKQWLEIDETDVRALAGLTRLAGDCADDLLDDLYGGRVLLPETARFCDDPDVLEYVKTLQRAYFGRLIEGRYDEAYVRERLTMGALHEVIGLDLKWYLGAYSRYLRRLGERIFSAWADDLQRATRAWFALNKLVFFDIGLTFDTYVKQREATIQELSRRRRVTADIVGAQEEERKRIAADIHDDPVQAMTAVLIRLGMLGAQLTDPESRGVVQQLEASVRDAIARLRRLIVDLRPPELDREGLAAVLRSMLMQLEREHSIRCSVANELETEPGPYARVIAFRVVQEAVANARKHARASRLDVLLRPREDGVLASVTDDGVGFDVEDALRHAPPGHLGLAAMRERVELAGGWLELTSGAAGTSVTFWVPDLALGEAAA
jgi:signal transduction histidine kinase